MIVQKNFLTKLRDFGLNTYESRLWTALLSRGYSTAGELSDISNVPRSRTYDVLESLEKKGFIIRKLGKPIKYFAVPPEEVLERVKNKVKEDTEKRLSLMEELRGSTVLKELSLLHSQGVDLVDPSEIVGSISGRDNIHNHMEARLSKATSSLVLVTSSEGIQRKAEFLLPILKKLKQKGSKIRIATQVSNDIRAILIELSKYAVVRHTDLHARFSILNSSETILMLLDDKKVHPSYDTGIWINSSFFSSAFERSFDSKWQAMKSASDLLK